MKSEAMDEIRELNAHEIDATAGGSWAKALEVGLSYIAEKVLDAIQADKGIMQVYKEHVEGKGKGGSPK